MKLRTLTAACAALVSLSATAALAAEPVTAKLQQPLAQPTKFIAGGAMFVCEADACVANVPTSQTFSTATCKAVAAKTGAIVSFEGRKALDEARLTECNASAGKTTLAKQ
jgi:hypothetical protein